MNVSMNFEGRAIEVTVGQGTIIAASEYLRKERHNEFQENLNLIAALSTTDAAKDAAREAFQKYKENQIPTDGEINWWLKQPDGIRFSVVHGTKKNAKITHDQVVDLFDFITEEEYDSLIFAIDCAAQGKRIAEMMKKARDVGEREDLLKFEEIVRASEERSAQIEVDRQAKTEPPTDPESEAKGKKK